jgi:hypothetical protein
MKSFFVKITEEVHVLVAWVSSLVILLIALKRFLIVFKDVVMVAIELIKIFPHGWELAKKSYEEKTAARVDRKP